MIRTMFTRSWVRMTVAVLAGLLVGTAVPQPVPSLVGRAQAAVGPGAKIYVFPFQPVFKGVPKEITTQTTDLLKNEIKHSDEVQLQKGPIFVPESAATEVKPLSDKEIKQAERLKKPRDAQVARYTVENHRKKNVRRPR